MNDEEYLKKVLSDNIKPAQIMNEISIPKSVYKYRKNAFWENKKFLLKNQLNYIRKIL